MQNNLPNASFNGVEIQQGIFVTNYVDDSANVGDRTVNALRGRNAIEDGSVSCNINNTYAKASSLIIITPRSIGGDFQIWKAVSSAGHFLVTLSTPMNGANWEFDWLIIN